MRERARERQRENERERQRENERERQRTREREIPVNDLLHLDLFYVRDRREPDSDERLWCALLSRSIARVLCDVCCTVGLFCHS